jgi:hypothetical protein
LTDAVIEHERPSQSLPRVWSALQFRAVAGVKVDSLLDMLDGLFGLPFTPILGYFSVATAFFLYKKESEFFEEQAQGSHYPVRWRCQNRNFAFTGALFGALYKQTGAVSQ